MRKGVISECAAACIPRARACRAQRREIGVGAIPDREERLIGAPASVDVDVAHPGLRARYAQVRERLPALTVGRRQRQHLVAAKRRN